MQSESEATFDRLTDVFVGAVAIDMGTDAQLATFAHVEPQRTAEMLADLQIASEGATFVSETINRARGRLLAASVAALLIASSAASAATVSASAATPASPYVITIDR
jgi:hypothetical protein